MDPSKQSLDPGSGWTIEQDNILIGAYINNNMDYEALKRKLPGKTREQCKARWSYYMQQTGNKGAWTRHEDQILHACQKEYGNRWKSIKHFLPGRSENAVKNRWNALLRKTSPSPADADSGSPGSGKFYRGDGTAPLHSMSRQQLINDAAEARRKVQVQQEQLRQMQQAQQKQQARQGGALNSSDMHLRLSPGSFGIQADSPGPSGDHTWGMNNSNTSFGFFGPTPEQTPQKGESGGPRLSSGSAGNSFSATTTPVGLKVDTNAPYGYNYPSGNRGGADSRGSKSLDESTSSMSHEDMAELAEAFVAQEVEKFRKQTGETMSAEDQLLMRKAFVAGMQHSPPEKEMSAADLQWDFDQSGSIDAMISIDEDHGHFDGVVQGHAIFAQSSKSPDKLSRSNMSISHSGLNRTNSQGEISIEGASWGGLLFTDPLNTENLDDMSMSLLNLSLEESQDQNGGSGFHP